MKTAYYLEMAYFSGHTLEKRVVSNTTKFSSQSNKLTKSSAACMENLENTQDLPKQ